MRIAKTKDGHWIEARQAKAGVDYYCGRCHEVVRCRHTKGGASFYHYHPKCPTSSSLNESVFHAKAKQDLSQWLMQQGYQPQLEYVVSSEQRSDIFVRPRTAFEIQRSPLSARDYSKRHERYKTFGYKDYWLLLGSYYHQAVHRYPFLQYNTVCGFYYYTYDKVWQIHYHVTKFKTTEVLPVTQFPFAFPERQWQGVDYQHEQQRQYQTLCKKLYRPTQLLYRTQQRWYECGERMQQVQELYLPLSLPCSDEVEWALKTAYLLEDEVPKTWLPADWRPFWQQFVMEYEQRLWEQHQPPTYLWT